MSEQSDITSPLLKALRKLPGVWAMRVHSGSARGGKQQLAPDGTPDIFVIVRGTHIFFECKTEPGKERPSQMEQFDRIAMAGGTVIVIRSVHDALDIVRAYLPLVTP